MRTFLSLKKSKFELNISLFKIFKTCVKINTDQKQKQFHLYNTTSGILYTKYTTYKPSLAKIFGQVVRSFTQMKLNEASNFLSPVLVVAS